MTTDDHGLTEQELVWADACGMTAEEYAASKTSEAFPSAGAYAEASAQTVERLGGSDD